MQAVDDLYFPSIIRIGRFIHKSGNPPRSCEIGPMTYAIRVADRCPVRSSLVPAAVSSRERCRGSSVAPWLLTISLTLEISVKSFETDLAIAGKLPKAETAPSLVVTGYQSLLGDEPQDASIGTDDQKLQPS